jgi:predicted permease
MWQRLSAVFRRNRFERDLDDEIGFHLAMYEQRLREAGMSEAEARDAARRKFGNVVLVKEEARDLWLFTWLESLWLDLRYALRSLRKSPGFAATAVLILALGTGINSAIFSVVDHVLLEPLPFPQPERLYAIYTASESKGTPHVLTSGPDFLDFHDQNRSFSSMLEYIPQFTFTWTGEGEPRLVNCTPVTDEFFATFGLSPYMGRFYEPREFTYLNDDVVVISYRFWKNKLSSDPHVLGRVIHLQDAALTIVGVTSPAMSELFPNIEVWPKMTTRPSWPFLQLRGNKFLNVVGRLKPGVSPAQAEDDLSAILRRAPGEAADARVYLVPLRDDFVGSVRLQLQVIMAAVAIVLLVTCVNVAALLLARSVKRQTEIALRTSLGAGRRRLTQQLIVEGLVLTACGAAVGTVLAVAGLKLLGRMPVWSLPRMAGIHLNASALLVTGAIAIATALAFGWIPSVSFSSLNLLSALRSGHREVGSGPRRSLAWLVVVEVACSVVLTVSGALLLHSFWRVARVDPGFQPEALATVYLRTNYYAQEGANFYASVLDAVSTIPGVRSAAVADCMPGRAATEALLLFDDRSNDPQRPAAAQSCWASPDFFRTTVTPLVKGRLFSAHDDHDAPAVAVINAEAAREYFPGADPIGRRIGVNYNGPGRRGNPVPRWREIVGVVGDIKFGPLESPSRPAVYMPHLQDETWHDMAGLGLFIRSTGNPIALADSIRARIHSVAPNEPVQDIIAMRVVLSKTMATRRYSLFLVAAFAVLGVLLAALGIYGVVSYTSSQRRQEFGVRAALGATSDRLLSLVLKQGFVLTAAGAALGLVVALLLTRSLSSLLFQVSPFDVLSFIAAAAVLGVVSIVASLIPAVSASRVDPMEALRAE